MTELRDHRDRAAHHKSGDKLAPTAIDLETLRALVLVAHGAREGYAAQVARLLAITPAAANGRVDRLREKGFAFGWHLTELGRALL